MSIAHQLVNGYTNINTFEFEMPALSTTDSVIDYGSAWLVKYRYKDSHNVLRYKGDPVHYEQTLFVELLCMIRFGVQMQPKELDPRFYDFCTRRTVFAVCIPHWH